MRPLPPPEAKTLPAKSVPADLVQAFDWRWIFAIFASLALIALATIVIVAIDFALAPSHLVFGYLVPTAIVAIRFGKVPAALSSIASAVAAAFFLYAPRFSLYIADPVHITELVLFSVLAFTASQVIADLARHGQK